jgi:hypothetical protein
MMRDSWPWSRSRSTIPPGNGVGQQEVARCGMATVTIDQANRFGDE